MSMNNLNVKIGNKLYLLRSERNISRKQLSRNVNLSINSIANIENGYHEIKISNLKIILAYFNMSLSDFFLEVDE